MTDKISLTEVGPRDGLQSAPCDLQSTLKVELINRLIDAGLRRLEVASFVNPKKVPQMAEAEAVISELPKRDDVKQGCIAYKIAAHASDVALGIPHTRDWDDDLTKARAALNWEKHFELAFDGEFARALHV